MKGFAYALLGVPVVGKAMFAVDNGRCGCVVHHCVGLGVHVVACTPTDMQRVLGLADM